jgi:hypothetical protein
MPFQKGHPGGPGRPPKPVEDAKQSVLLRLFDEKAEEAVIKAQLTQARKGDTTAATWLWDRKYGKVKDVQEQSGELTIRIVYDNPNPDTPETP